MHPDFFADLHCHSTCSDGSKTPKELVLLAKEIGLKGLAITDHDSINAYQMALPFAKEAGIDLLTGVEFSTMHQNTSIHILAYAYPDKNVLIKDFCEKHLKRRLERNLEILNRLEVHGIHVSEKELEETPGYQSNKTLGRPHIAQVMMKKGYVKSIQEAFKKYIGEGKPCYAEGASFSTEETIDLIHQAKGLAVIAHPHLIENGKILQELLSLNFDGIECYYAKFHRDLSDRWLKIARRKNWIITGGSDFHGDIKPNLPLGASFVSRELFNILFDHFKMVSKDS